MKDELDIRELVSGLEGLCLPSGRFRHREHVRIAHHYLLRDGYPHAIETVMSAIRRFGTHHGSAHLFHVTMTQCWVRLVAAALSDESPDRSFGALVARHPELLDKREPLGYYSEARLFSPAAREGWLEPDLRELPRCPIHRGEGA